VLVLCSYTNDVTCTIENRKSLVFGFHLEETKITGVDVGDFDWHVEGSGSNTCHLLLPCVSNKYAHSM